MLKVSHAFKNIAEKVADEVSDPPSTAWAETNLLYSYLLIAMK